MPRIPPSTYLPLAGLLPAYAAALGLGDVVPKSFLNQPFLAEIPITAATPDELTGLKVTLASPETFDRYGLPRPTFLGEMQFAIASGPRGPAIRVSSVQPVVEPFVTLLVEVQWPQGKLLREYTVLLDPPAFAGTAAAKPVEAPKAATASPRPQEPAALTPDTAAPPMAQPEPRDSGGAGSSYGPVARNETLWGIANRNRAGTNADLNQLMLAIYRANPEAFAGNINRLRAGSILRIPMASDLKQVGRSEAMAEVQRQNLQWRGGSSAAAPETGRLRLVPPAETQRPGAAPVAGGAVKDLQTALEDTRRQVAIKDAELAALKAQLDAASRKQAAGSAEQPLTLPPGQTAPIAKPVPAQPEQAATPSQPSEAAPPPSQPAQVAKPAPAPPIGSGADKAKESGGGIGELFGNIWLWIAAALVVLGGVFIARRRGLGGDTERWTPRVAARAGAEEGAGRPRGERDDMIVVEERRPTATGTFERSSPGMSTAQLDAELPLERTISTDAPVNLDQADPIAEADFHMAYGLYDQAADLLTAASAREPSRKDLKLKLLEVCFVWENREQFLKEAREFRKRLQSDSDPDWKRIALMGKQLAPQDPLFAGAATGAVTAEDLDLPLGAPASGGVDMPLHEESEGLDFDLSTGQTSRTQKLDLDFGGGKQGGKGRTSTEEGPTMLASELDGAITTESPTVEASYAGTPTVETPTLETPMRERTMETPTIEAQMATARIPGAPRPQDISGDQTEEIDLDELGLDLTGLDDAARDMSTGLQEVLPNADAGGEVLDLDLSDAASTAEMQRLTGAFDAPTLKEQQAKRSNDALPGEDTAEQPGVSSDDSQISKGLEATGKELGIDLDLGSVPQDLTATGLRTLRGKIPEDATMTEVGTKLDLARAYLDMGDPDGARSILNEVLEEGDATQRDEAQNLLNGIGR
jgi:pilus assembly protein FimV